MVWLNHKFGIWKEIVMHDRCRDGSSGPVRCVAIIGLRRRDWKWMETLVKRVKYRVLNGGSIDDGSNMVRTALAACTKADLVLINRRFSRSMPGGWSRGKRVLPFNGVSELKGIVSGW